MVINEVELTILDIIVCVISVTFKHILYIDDYCISFYYVFILDISLFSKKNINIYIYKY